MSARRAAIIVAGCLLCSLAAAQESRVIKLETAFARALEVHPELRRFDPARESAAAAVEVEGSRQPLRLDLELENFPRTHRDSRFDSAEATLSLASVFERGGKREARVAVALAQLGAIDIQLEQGRIDLLAEVARRYLDFVEGEYLSSLAAADVDRRNQAVAATTQRVRAGATSESVRLTAEAALARALLEQHRATARARAASLRLAILWKSRDPDFDRPAGNLLDVPPVPTLDSLRELVERSPELRRFADESRLREARIQLARAGRTFDVDWRVGIRRLEEDGSWAAVAGISVPLGSVRRADLGIRGAQADLAALSLQREAQALSLEATLIEAHTRLTSAASEVAAYRDALLPKFEQAERASERAFRGGALTYAEWAQVQNESIEARRQQLTAALEAHRALIEIQRLTATPFTTARTQP